MKIGLLDVDGHNFPNLALMKISAYHKSKGDAVEWINHFKKYDIAYKSKVFTFTDDDLTCINADKVIQGGTGYDLKNKLPDEIENMFPDYSLYNTKDTAYGFTTRGCPRSCPFCIVGKKEGLTSYKVGNLDNFFNGQKNIELCDPNLLACKTDRLDILEQLIDSKAWVNFNQGLDIRFMDDLVIDKLIQIKIKMLHFAWDRPNQSELIIKNLDSFKRVTNIDFRKLRVYVLTNYETDFEFDLYRVYKLKQLGYDPYIMIFDKHKLPKGHKILRLQRWVNNKFIFRSCEKFEDYVG
ncbi:hypothetical protein [Brassicibacter mesophilus]|uniref:hypothetical protein n=1 Tax=Brassicibacter mesophilus TaxID=745119 RepID=UPI003D204336